MSDGIRFHATLKDASGNYRSLSIITDTFQAAVSIAKMKAKWNEVVLSVDTGTEEIFIDYSVCKGAGK